MREVEKMPSTTLSTLATFDDLRRCIQVLTDGSAEEEFVRILSTQDKFRRDCLDAASEAQRIQRELDASLQSMADLESKLFHARRLLEIESKARREAEHERDALEKKMVAVADLLQNERNLKDETKDKLAFLHTMPRKRKSLNRRLEEKYGNDINSTGSFLSDLSITQSEDDFLDVGNSRNNNNNWHKRRPSAPKHSAALPGSGSKRSRISMGDGGGVGGDVASSNPPPSTTTTTRRSARLSSARVAGEGIEVQQSTATMPNGAGAERICAITKVTIPTDGNGPIQAESHIESVPMHQAEEQPDNRDQVGDGPAVGAKQQPRRSPYKGATAPPMTPLRSIPVTTMQSPAQQQQAQMRANLSRKHNFNSKTFIRTDTCNHCQKKIRFGAVGLRCRYCPIRCHVDCGNLLTISCVAQTGTPNLKGPMGSIAEYAPSLPPMVPALIVHCVNEIESRGLNEVGIYRVSGSEREVKLLKERFLRAKTTPHLGTVDVHVLCGCIKDFLRSLREPLIPTHLWKDFCNAVQNPIEQDLQKDLYKAIDALPPANRDTLAFMILHFQRVAESRDVLMPIDNLARVFGPTIVGYSSLDPDQHAIFTEVYTQFSVMQNLLKLNACYWQQFVGYDSEKENDLPPQQTLNIEQQQPPHTPSHHNKESVYSLYATPMKSTMKRKYFFGTPPPMQNKK